MLKEDIAVFGFKDSMAGQLLSFLREENKFNIAYFISLTELQRLDIEKEHSKRPNRKTEFDKNGKIFGKDLIVFSTINKNSNSIDYVSFLKSKGINKCLLLEDNLLLRKKIFSILKDNEINLITYIHPSSFIGDFTSIGEGSVIFPNCYLGYKSDIGCSTIIQSSSTIEHHNSIGSFCNICPRLTTGGFTLVDDLVEIMMSVDIINKVKIDSICKIGAGSLVMNNCESNYLYYGRPAKKIRTYEINY